MSSTTMSAATTEKAQSTTGVLSMKKPESDVELQPPDREISPPTGDLNKGVASNNPASRNDAAGKKPSFERGPRFWAILGALSVTGMLSALEGTVVSTALPTVVHELGGGDMYIWAVNGYFLPSMVFQPLYGQAANIFGRRYVIILAVSLFAVGSAICGSAVNMTVLIVGRIIQGAGGGGISTLVNLVICDLVPLRERGGYLAMIYGALTIGNGIGPFIGGIIVQSTTWRWIFYMNLPIAGFALALLVAFLQVGYHKEPVLAKLKRIDYVGHSIFVGSVVAILLALTSAGVKYAWSSWNTIFPLVLGIVGLGAFLAYEGSRFCLEPTMPLRFFKNRTTLGAFILGFMHSLLTIWVIYFLPVYFQAVLGSSPARSGVQLLPTVLILIPFAAISGKLLQRIGKYRLLHFLGFALMIVGFGVFTLLHQHSSTAAWVCFQGIEAAGAGFVASSLLPAAQAPLNEADTATVTGTFSFIRSFGISFAVTIPGTMFNNRFDHLAGRISDVGVRNLLVGVMPTSTLQSHSLEYSQILYMMR
ncbi:MFS general substrate transporter-like protein [Halenospora varia]|nr:MFS general substrate transporter-like protein [Halenospora varia]